jgi:XRE family transcriptional regulator, aerobic/anaerobic benzoate catabolism transcriptional regulator
MPSSTLAEIEASDETRPNPVAEDENGVERAAPAGLEADSEARKEPFLVALGERVRAMRARRGLTRKTLAERAGVSERHLANLEYGVGNASILILLQVSQALKCSLAELLGDVTTRSPEWLLLRELLSDRDEATLRRVVVAVSELIGARSARSEQPPARPSRIALIGLRGAGKSTLGRMLAEDLDFPFVELSREIEKLAGCSISEILGLYGQSAYRRYERRALEETIQTYPEAVIATAGGLVSDLVSFNLLLRQCTTVWLRANPEDHMSRVMAQGDLRPMAASREAMEDLKAILAARAAFYSKANMDIDTSAQPLAETFQILRAEVREAISLPPGPVLMQEIA